MAGSQTSSSPILFRSMLAYLLIFWAFQEVRGLIVNPETTTCVIFPSFRSPTSSPRLCWSVLLTIGRGLGSIRDLLSQPFEYQSTADLKPLPDQPKLMVQMLFSIVLSNSNLTNPINDAIIDCIATATLTPVQHIGLYNAESFTRSMIQAEYYADVMEEESETFPENLDAYIRQGNLTDCVYEEDVGLATEGMVYNGRTTIAPRTGAIISSVGSVPGWIVGVVVGGVALIATVGLVILTITGNRLFPESAYRQEHSSGTENNSDLERGQLPEHVQQEILQELKTIAGQRTNSSYVAV